MEKPVNPDPAVAAEMTGAPETGLATRGDVAVGAVAGDFSQSDLRMPRLQIAYGVGGLAENFQPGDLVLAQDNLLVHKGEPLQLIVCSAVAYWKEYLSREQFASGTRPRTFMTEAEVRTNGGTTTWVGDKGPSFSKAMDLKMLIRKPKDLVCGLFGLTLSGVEYAPAVWSVDKSAYRRVSPVILSAAMFALKAKGLLSGLFELKTQTEKINGNVTVVPSIKLVGHNDEALVKEAMAALAV